MFGIVEDAVCERVEEYYLSHISHSLRSFSFLSCRFTELTSRIQFKLVPISRWRSKSLPKSNES